MTTESHAATDGRSGERRAATHRQAEGVVSEVVEGQAVIVSHTDGQMHTLNVVGTLMWELLAEVAELDELVAALAARYPDVDLDIVRGDVDAFLADGVAKGIVESVGS